MVLDSQTVRSSSCKVGTRPLGLSARYAGCLLPPNLPPTSTRSCFSPSSPTAHITFCTFEEVLRPQIFSIQSSRFHGSSFRRERLSRSRQASPIEGVNPIPPLLEYGARRCRLGAPWPRSRPRYHR